MIKSILTNCCLFLTTSLFAVEGNEPVPLLELPPPTVEEETLKITSPYKFPCLSLWIEGGKNELGKVYEVRLNGSPGINESFAMRGLKIEDKILYAGKGEKRFIGSRSITEIDARAGAYKISDSWNEFGIVNSAISLYLGENIFKLFGSGCYESEYIWDFGVLWGRSFGESVFAGVGISGPHYLTPMVQINWMPSRELSINISHRSKEVTNTFDSLYMYQPYVIQNSELEHERWNSLSTINFNFQNKVTMELTHKEIENIIYWNMFTPNVMPLNGGKHHKLGAKLELLLLKIPLKIPLEIPQQAGLQAGMKVKNIASVEYLFLRPLTLNLYYFIPSVLFANTLSIFLPAQIEVGLENKYVKNEYFGSSMSDYWLFSLKGAKKVNKIEFWGRINNLTNTKYEIIPGRDGPGTCFQIGVELTLL
ncbi:MAG: hypothetical protein HY769_00015 [Candidatus Stahlbacteria bacterium]|nr:hypothetical protein [Candidatus Stahlbacteria bacterium]